MASERAPQRYLIGRHAGQSIMEYGMFVAVVAAALVAMSVYIRRSIQANLKGMEEQMNAEALEKKPTP